MPCARWFEIEKHYRLAVHAYCEAVDRLDSTQDFETAWQHAESIRAAAERFRAVLLNH